MNNPLPILKNAVNKVPFVKYALGVAGIAAALAYIKSLNIEDNHGLPTLSLLVMLGFMVLLFVFSTFTTSKHKPLRVCGYALVFTTVSIACISAMLLFTSLFFEFPKPVSAYTKSGEIDLQKKNAVSTLEKLGMSWVEETKTIKAIQILNFDDKMFQELIPVFSALQPMGLEISFNPMPSAIDEMISQNKFTNLNALADVKSLKRLDLKYSFHLIDITQLNKLTNLTSLTLNQCFQLKSLTGIQDLPGLEELNLKSSFALENLEGIENLTALKTLNLSSCKALMGSEPLRALLRLKSVTSLNLSVSGLSSTEGLNSLESLREMDMHSCAGIKNLDGMKGLKNLQFLDLGNCAFLTDLSGLEGITALRELNLGQCGYLKDISPLKGLGNLEYLSFIGDVSLTDISPLQGLKRLKELNLRGCKSVTVEQIQELQKHLPTTKIYFSVNG